MEKQRTLDILSGVRGYLRIDEQSLQSLKKRRFPQVPQDVLNKLEGIINQVFKGEVEFLDVLRKTIGEEQTDIYKSLILEHALNTFQSPYFIGEEKRMSSDEDFRNAELTYRDLKTFYEKELLYDVAKEFHYRENEVKTKGSSWVMRIFRIAFFKLPYGYGSRPFWLLPYSLIVIVIFALIFALLTIPRGTKSGIYFVQAESDKKEEILSFRKGMLFLDCLYFSLLSFTTFGYGTLHLRKLLEFFRLEPVEFKPVGWSRIFVGLEATIGIYLLALLATVLFGR
ncbi:MAG: two pore domain potassium channel family protein [Deltaproteobacteria bacterium]|nr:two pore domain potassium channel family protein [Deltaproteobacteria bacterium]